MTMIDIKRTTEVLVSFEESKKTCSRLYEEASQSSMQLRNLSGMNQVRRTLEHILEDMQEEYQVLEQMNRCLEGSCRSYSRYEEGITEFAEEKGTDKWNQYIFGTLNIPEHLFRLLR